MAIPDYQTVMLPLLKYVGDGEEHSLRDTIEALAERFQLSPEERKELLPSGQQATFDNRVGWARTYMKKAGLVETTRRGHFRITERGKEALREDPATINVVFLERYPEFIEFRQARRERNDKIHEAILAQEQTPEESLEAAYQKLRDGLATELLQTVMQCSPTFFERLVIDLLVKMGYGGSRKEAGQAVGRTSDGGIDGIIKEDRLGLDIIYIQAKRWESTVGRPEIQKFAGALQGQRARKGIFITSSNFTKEATEYVSMIDSKIILIGGTQLANLMIDHGVGVSPMAVYEVKRIDTR